MGLILELIGWLVIEVVFWGLMFWTGYCLTFLFTLGQRKLAPAGPAKPERSEPKFVVTAIIGALFWIGLGIAAILIGFKGLM